MEQLPDRMKLRREYVRKKASAYTSGLVYGVLCLSASLLTCALVVSVVGLIMFGIGGRMALDYHGDVLPIVFGLGIAVLLTPTFSWFFWDKVQDAKRAASVAYVPPVTPNSLPVAEVLVRASEEPLIAQYEVLLRPAKEREPVSEELLRSAQIR